MSKPTLASQIGVGKLVIYMDVSHTCERNCSRGAAFVVQQFGPQNRQKHTATFDLHLGGWKVHLPCGTSNAYFELI